MNGSMRGLLSMHAFRVQKLRSNVKLHRVIGASQNCSFSSFSCNLDKQQFFTAGNNSLPSRDDAVAPCATSSDSSPFRTFSHGRMSGNNNPESLRTTIVTMPSQISDSSRFQQKPLLSTNDHQTESLSLFSTNHHHINHNKNNNTNKNINNHNNHNNNHKHQNNMTVSNTQQPKQQQFDQYMQDHKIDSLFNELTTSLIQNQPENPIDFIINELEAKRRAQPYRKVVFVLGGPGSGKGTQCAKMVEQFGFVHFSAGDLLRAESESDSETGKMISNMIREGQIVPGHITIGLLKKAIFSHPDSENTTFLIDGFPREMKQALDFERQVTPCQFVLFFDCPESVLEERLLSRGLTSGRSDDNIVSIRKRFQTYQKQTMPVIDYFAAHDKVKHIITSKPVHEVFNEVRGIFGL